MVRGDTRSCAAAGPARRWLVVVLLAMVAGALTGQLLLAPPAAEAQAGAARRAVVVVPGRITPETYGLYLVDVQNGTICVYQYFKQERSTAQSLRLMAARTFVYDVQLDSYNTAPLPKEVANMVAGARRLKDVTTQPK